MSIPTITWPSNTREIINAMRDAAGREIEMGIPQTPSGCYACTLDPINNTSTDPFCSVCGGDYWIIPYSGLTISGHVRWFPADTWTPTPGGIVYEGDCVVTIEHTNVNIQAVKAADYFLVDGKRMVLWKYVLRGKPDINRIRLMLKEEES